MTGTIFNNRWAALGFVAAIALLAALAVGPEDGDGQLASMAQTSQSSEPKSSARPRKRNPWAAAQSDIRVPQTGGDAIEIEGASNFAADEFASNVSPGALRFEVEAPSESLADAPATRSASAPARRFASDEELIDDTRGFDPVPDRDFVPQKGEDDEADAN